MKSETDEEHVFRVFAETYPHETYDTDPDRFCEIVRRKGYDMNNEQIGKLINDTRICQMKIGLELVIHEEPDGRKFLNYWDWKHGDDICCQIIDGKLFKSEYDEEDNKLPKKEISFDDFVKLVEAVV